MKAGRLWWHVHHWVGLKLSIFLSFVLLTGTLAVASNEIDWVLQPTLRVAPSSVAPGEPDWQRIVAGAAHHPHVARIQYLAEPVASAFAVRVLVAWDDGQLRYLHVHPTTGVVQGSGGWVDAQRVLRNMHRHLNLPVPYGVPIVGSMALLLLVSFATSLVVYKKWWRGFLRAPRRRDARTWWGDFHRLAGVWSMWFVLLMALTGVWYLAEQVGLRAPVDEPPKVVTVAANPVWQVGHFAKSLAAARRAAPTLKIEMIRFPTEKSGAFVFDGQRTAWLVRPRANAVWTDVRSGRVLATYDARAMTVHQRISEMADPLHFGTFAGYWSKLTWLLFGSLLTGLSVSGVAIYALRIGRELRQVTPFAFAIRRIWKGMGHWHWPASALVVTGFLMIWTIFAQRA